MCVLDVKDDDESPQNNSGDADHSFQTENGQHFSVQHLYDNCHL